MTNELRERKRYLKLIAILFANRQELTKTGEAYAFKSLEEHTPLEAALDINLTQNNMKSRPALLFVEL